MMGEISSSPRSRPNSARSGRSKVKYSMATRLAANIMGLSPTSRSQGPSPRSPQQTNSPKAAEEGQQRQACQQRARWAEPVAGVFSRNKVLPASPSDEISEAQPRGTFLPDHDSCGRMGIVGMDGLCDTELQALPGSPVGGVPWGVPIKNECGNTLSKEEYEDRIWGPAAHADCSQSAMVQVGS